MVSIPSKLLARNAQNVPKHSRESTKQHEKQPIDWGVRQLLAQLERAKTQLTKRVNYNLALAMNEVFEVLLRRRELPRICVECTC